MESTSPIEYLGTETRLCACGCNQPYTVHGGKLSYDEGRDVTFELALVQHGDGQRHVWVALISGPWTDDDARDCWVFIHGLRQDEGVSARVEELNDSPWSAVDLEGNRPLPRDEVMNNPPAKTWVFERFNDLMHYHKDVGPFMFPERDYG